MHALYSAGRHLQCLLTLGRQAHARVIEHISLGLMDSKADIRSESSEEDKASFFTLPLAPPLINGRHMFHLARC
ncbi:hypothetical protein AcW1_003941 [Taiwanofungus camphoratus]|nr:hypothetical protein AcV5_003890 [Antrodia cinnamomea]KAI0937907.1 hypothetical protein AcW1_003941 [Antrodia cinnamomea]